MAAVMIAAMTTPAKHAFSMLSENCIDFPQTSVNMGRQAKSRVAAPGRLFVVEMSAL